jgi:post-segregation antitoxin (ccd killing protein)
MMKFCQPNQLSLLDLLADLRPKISISVLNIDLLLRTAIAKAIKESNLSRIQIAARMSEALDIEITKSMLDAWTAESREGLNRFPACYLPAFCDAVQSIEPLKILADLNGCFVIQGPEALDLEMKRIEDKEKELTEKKKAVKAMRQGIAKERR